MADEPAADRAAADEAERVTDAASGARLVRDDDRAAAEDRTGCPWSPDHLSRRKTTAPKLPASTGPYEAAVERARWVNANVTVDQVLTLLGQRSAGRRLDCPVCFADRAAKDNGDSVFCFECNKRYDIVDLFAEARGTEGRGKAARMIIDGLGLTPVLRCDPTSAQRLEDMRAALCDALWTWATQTFPGFTKDTAHIGIRMCRFGHLHPHLAADGGGTYRQDGDEDGRFEMPLMDVFMRVSNTLSADVSTAGDGDAWLPKAKAALAQLINRRIK